METLNMSKLNLSSVRSTVAADNAPKQDVLEPKFETLVSCVFKFWVIFIFRQNLIEILYRYKYIFSWNVPKMAEEEI